MQNQEMYANMAGAGASAAPSAPTDPGSADISVPAAESVSLDVIV